MTHTLSTQQQQRVIHVLHNVTQADPQMRLQGLRYYTPQLDATEKAAVFNAMRDKWTHLTSFASIGRASDLIERAEKPGMGGEEFVKWGLIAGGAVVLVSGIVWLVRRSARHSIAPAPAYPYNMGANR